MEIIQFTDAAVEAIKRYQQTLQIPEDHFLRIGIRQKNENDKRLLIGFDVQNARDKKARIQGIDIIYSPGEVFFFAGMMVDFTEQDNRKGFTFVEQKKSGLDLSR